MMKNKNGKQSFAWGSLLIVFGILGLIDLYTDLTAWAWATVLFFAGLGMLGIYLKDRSDWGWLIPTYVMWAVAALVTLIETGILVDSFIATFVLTTIAIPFLVGYWRNHEQWGLLIPAYVLLAVGVMVGLLERGFLTDLMVPAYVMFAIAIPFFVVYGRNPRQWWPLIPGGIMAIIGASFLIAEAMVGYVIPVVMILAGILILLRQIRHQESIVNKPKSS